mmetsp:Transcript_18132/g.23396  ORF Transcript_18132/g.23396 Transcript_18132/m.23396 type:complete len:188 (+) Transcript_18132:127-690(+)
MASEQQHESLRFESSGSSIDLEDALLLEEVVIPTRFSYNSSHMLSQLSFDMSCGCIMENNESAMEKFHQDGALDMSPKAPTRRRNKLSNLSLSLPPALEDVDDGDDQENAAGDEIITSKRAMCPSEIFESDEIAIKNQVGASYGKDQQPITVIDALCQQRHAGCDHPPRMVTRSQSLRSLCEILNEL